MDKNKMIKQITLDEDFKLSDYSVDELETMFNVKKDTKQKFKNDYFAYYDDIKSSSLKKQDWWFYKENKSFKIKLIFFASDKKFF